MSCLVLLFKKGPVHLGWKKYLGDCVTLFMWFQNSQSSTILLQTLHLNQLVQLVCNKICFNMGRKQERMYEKLDIMQCKCMQFGRGSSKIFCQNYLQLGQRMRDEGVGLTYLKHMSPKPPLIFCSNCVQIEQKISKNLIPNIFEYCLRLY